MKLTDLGQLVATRAYKFSDNAPWVDDTLNMYGGKEDRIWIITEWDHSVTTILFPGKY